MYSVLKRFRGKIELIIAHACEIICDNFTCGNNHFSTDR